MSGSELAIIALVVCVCVSVLYSSACHSCVEEATAPPVVKTLSTPCNKHTVTGEFRYPHHLQAHPLAC